MPLQATKTLQVLRFLPVTDHPHLSGSTDKAFQLITGKREQGLSKMVLLREKFQFASKHTTLYTLRCYCFCKKTYNPIDIITLFRKFKSNLFVSSQIPDPYQVFQQRIQVRDRIITDETRAIQKKNLRGNVWFFYRVSDCNKKIKHSLVLLMYFNNNVQLFKTACRFES